MHIGQAIGERMITKKTLAADLALLFPSAV
jgi:hypothetical protein